MLALAHQISGSTLLVVCGLLSLVSAAVLTSVLFRVPGHRGLGFWTFSMASYCGATLIVPLSAELALSLGHAIVTGSQLAGLGSILALIGVRRFLRLPAGVLWPVVPAAMILTAQVWFLDYLNAEPVRAIVSGTMVPTLLNAMAGWHLVRHTEPELRPASSIAGAFHLQWAFVMAARAVWWSVMVHVPQGFDPTLPASLLSMIVFIFGASPAWLWMVRKRMDAAALAGAELRDRLTGVPGRAGLWEQGARLHEAALRDGRAGSVLLIAIDHLDQVSHRYGAADSDSVVKAVSQLLAQQLRDRDLIGRIGEDEFMAVLPDIGFDDSFNLADRLRVETMRLYLPLTSGERLRCTVSIGLCPFEGHSRTWPGIVLEAERALFCARELGRNCVEVAPPTELAAA